MRLKTYKTTMNIDVYNFITSNLKIKHKYFKGLNFNLISNFAQCNLKCHPPYPNVCNTHDESHHFSSDHACPDRENRNISIYDVNMK